MNVLKPSKERVLQWRRGFNTRTFLQFWCIVLCCAYNCQLLCFYVTFFLNNVGSNLYGILHCTTILILHIIWWIVWVWLFTAEICSSRIEIKNFGCDLNSYPWTSLGVECIKENELYIFNNGVAVEVCLK
jgi:hypothetical protein